MLRKLLDRFFGITAVQTEFNEMWRNVNRMFELIDQYQKLTTTLIQERAEMQKQESLAVDIIKYLLQNVDNETRTEVVRMIEQYEFEEIIDPLTKEQNNEK